MPHSHLVNRQKLLFYEAFSMICRNSLLICERRKIVSYLHASFVSFEAMTLLANSALSL